MEKGLFEANLGNGLYKKRIARPNQGKSDGYRVLLAFKQKNHLFFYMVLLKISEPTSRKTKKLYIVILRNIYCP